MWFDFRKNTGSETWTFKISDDIDELSFVLSKDEMTALSIFLKAQGF